MLKDNQISKEYQIADTNKIKFKGKQMKKNEAVKRSINITEEALAIGKVPPEEVARRIAMG